MTLDEYQELAQRTSSSNNLWDKILNGVLGLAGESGECSDIVKKALFQGHSLDREHLIEEAGDCAWYLAELASGLDIPLEIIFSRNIEKLRKRYPDGFDAEKSKHRQTGDV